eukprot:TRINITY_DN1983_c0_g1_i1.p1 TRINITY_DN1983_c0_g1~~TRINITY_DN1983_c0_g1_i1.p1  ORF type:complete len:380 (-),score=100.21 TRINITY_DN1983_c0_g1_i1:105-1190(-)
MSNNNNNNNTNEDEELEGDLAPTITNLLQRSTLKWVFVGGKGGVGKTTCSCSVAIQMAKIRPSVLVISTDPAHNLSDAFNQKFTKYPTLVKGFDNLFAMEIDPKFDPESLGIPTGGIGGQGLPGGGPGGILGSDFMGLGDLMNSIPGIDEAMGFVEVMKQVQSMEYSLIIFDTAPTGHTLRFLSFPPTLEKAMNKLLSLKSRFGGLFSQFSSMMGGAGGEMDLTQFETIKRLVEEVNIQFKDSDLTTFIPVCIPEFLSLYETERLIQELAKFEMDVQDIIVNQILYPEKGSECKLCTTRSKMQNKYMSQMSDLYPDFHIIKLPLLNEEVRGVEAVSQFSKFLVEPFDPNSVPSSSSGGPSH